MIRCRSILWAANAKPIEGSRWRRFESGCVALIVAAGVALGRFCSQTAMVHLSFGHGPASIPDSLNQLIASSIGRSFGLRVNLPCQDSMV